MKTFYLDSNILIYLAQPQSSFFSYAINLLEHAETNGHKLITSSAAVAEYLVAQQKDGVDNNAVINLFEEDIITELPFGHAEAVAYAAFRQTNNSIHPVDAMHFAAAVTAKADVFVTNDKLLHKVKIKGLSVTPLTKFQ